MLSKVAPCLIPNRYGDPTFDLAYGAGMDAAWAITKYRIVHERGLTGTRNPRIPNSIGFRCVAGRKSVRMTDIAPL